MLKLLLIEGRPAVGRGLRLLFDAEADLEVVGEALDCETALSLIRSLKPDVVVVDADFPRFDQPSTVDVLGQIGRHAPIVLLTLRDNRQIDQLADRLGGSLVVKTTPAWVLLDAIRAASGGA